MFSAMFINRDAIKENVEWWHYHTFYLISWLRALTYCTIFCRIRRYLIIHAYIGFSVAGSAFLFKSYFNYYFAHFTYIILVRWSIISINQSPVSFEERTTFYHISKTSSHYSNYYGMNIDDFNNITTQRELLRFVQDYFIGWNLFGFQCSLLTNGYRHTYSDKIRKVILETPLLRLRARMYNNKKDITVFQN